MDTPPTWNWSAAEGSSSPRAEPSRPEVGNDSSPPDTQPKTRANGRRYRPRTCRICLDTEEPKFKNGTTTFGVSSTSSRPTYESDDPELGRLLSPCKCKGSQKYVHEGCLNAWRLANPTEARNYWQCPTCKFTYQMSRLHWASALSSKWAQMGVTLVVLFLCIFILGFIADPILDLWFDPVGTISETVTSVVTDIEAKREPVLEYTTWYEHFVKGFFSLGLVGFAKSMVAMTPWQMWNLRATGALGGGRRQGTGRGRMENMNLAIVLLGAFTFLMGIWKAVRALSTRVLKRVSDRVMDVGGEDDDDEDEDEGSGPETRKDQ